MKCKVLSLSESRTFLSKLAQKIILVLATIEIILRVKVCTCESRLGNNGVCPVRKGTASSVREGNSHSANHN